MKILLAVFTDLWNFFTFGYFKKPSVKVKKNIADRDVATEVKEVIDTTDNTSLILREKAEIIDVSLVRVGQEGYVCVDMARVFVRPVWAFDTAFTTLFFGNQVQIMRYEGRFVQVQIKEELGWVLKDEITTSRSDIFPVFHKDVVYLPEHPETRKIRHLMRDEFFATELRLPLQSTEFVSYCSRQDGRKTPWSNERPRLAGNWQNLLKGHLGVHIGVEPKTGSVMEYQHRDGTGHVGYVKEVHADESIVLLSVGREVDGKYTEEPFTKKKWQEYRPVFIQVS